MDLKLSNSDNTDNYIIKRYPLDNCQIFNRPKDQDIKDWYIKYNVFDKNVYIFVDKTHNWNNLLPFNIYLKYRPIYIGKGYSDSNKDKKHRAIKHHDDLLSRYVSINPNRYECLILGDGMTDNEASSLEAFWIWYLTTQKEFSLSRRNIIGDLINKRRELKWEEYCKDFLQLDNLWKIPILIV